MRVHLAQAATEAGVDPDRLSFTDGLFFLTETLDLALILEPEEATAPLLRRLHQRMRQQVLPERHLRVNRRELKKRDVPPPPPFEPEDQFLDFVALLDPLASLATTATGGP